MLSYNPPDDSLTLPACKSPRHREPIWIHLKELTDMNLEATLDKIGKDIKDCKEDHGVTVIHHLIYFDFDR